MNEDCKKIEQEKAAQAYLYYKYPGFLDWIVLNGFNQVVGDNIQRYFALFQHHEMCREKRCADCSGLSSHWNTEADIQNGTVKNIRCAYREQQNQELAARQFAERTPIPEAFKETTFESLTRITSSAIEYIKNYVQLFPSNKPSGLYLHSCVHGVGRTSLMWVLVRELLTKGRLLNGFIFHTTPMFIDRLQTDMFTHEHLFINKATTCGLLLLDDFGREKATDWSSAKIEAIFEERSWYNRPIILSSIIPPDDWAWQSPQEKSVMSKIRKSTQVLNLYIDKDEDAKQPE